MAQQKETERVREIFDASAAHYDRGMAFSEKLFFGDGRAWACSQARGQVLEIAIGTGRNLPFYPAAVEITGIELSPAMLEIAGLRAQSLVDRSSWSSGMRRRSPSPISASIQWCARFRCAAFPTNDRPSQRCGAFCVQAAASWPSNTCAVQTPSSADLSACLRERLHNNVRARYDKVHYARDTGPLAPGNSLLSRNEKRHYKP